MTELPEKLLHFYMNPLGPFRSISELADGDVDMDAVFDAMSRNDTWRAGRFTTETRHKYMLDRARIEKRLRDDFCAMGGQPTRLHPFYAMLGFPNVFDLFPEAMRIEIPVKSVPSEVLSFTYVDSMASFELVANPEDMKKIHFFKDMEILPCHGKVFRLEDILAIINTFGVPTGPHYIEAQIWDEQVLKQHRPNANHCFQATTGSRA